MAQQGSGNEILIKKARIFCIGEGLIPSGCSRFPINRETPVALSCGKLHCAIVCESGHVFTVSTNTYHEWSVAEPSLVTGLLSAKVVQAACGDKFTLFLTDTGEVYSAGVNEHGQLGLGDTTARATPVLVRGLPPVKKVATGDSHSVVLTHNGEVWVCGSNSNGQLGNKDTELYLKCFTFVSSITQQIIDIACHDNNTILLAVCSEIFYNRFADNTNGYIRVPFAKVELVGVTGGQQNLLFKAKDGTIWTWDNVMRFYDKQELTRVCCGLEKCQSSKVFARDNRLAVVTDKGDVFVWAIGSKNDIDKNYSTSPIMFKKMGGLIVTDLAFGTDCTLILVKSEVQTSKVFQKDNVDYLTRPCVTDLERSIMKSLECPVCLKLMVTPIHMCVNGHSLCGTCFVQLARSPCPTCRKQFAQTKNFALQHLAEVSQLPCVGCLLRMPVLALEEHANVCPQRVIHCPLDEGRCKWSGIREDLRAHACSKHKEQVWSTLPHTFEQCLPDEEQTTLLLSKNNLLFFHRRFNYAKDSAQFGVRYLGLPTDAKKFRFKLELNVNNTDWNQVSLTKVCSFVSTVEEMFQSECCVTLEKHKVQQYCQNGHIPCKVSIINTETEDKTGQ